MARNGNRAMVERGVWCAWELVTLLVTETGSSALGWLGGDPTYLGNTCTYGHGAGRQLVRMEMIALTPPADARSSISTPGHFSLLVAYIVD